MMYSICGGTNDAKLHLDVCRPPHTCSIYYCTSRTTAPLLIENDACVSFMIRMSLILVQKQKLPGPWW
jgi:hypothetical protein